MQTTASGLQYDDSVVGSGKRAEAGRTVSVHYTGWLYENGTKGAKFDSSKDRNDPFEFERGGDVGGTWYWNRYPGIACDVESYSYFCLLYTSDAADEL